MISKRRLKVDLDLAESDLPALESSELSELSLVEPSSPPWLLERLKLSKVTSPSIRILEKRALPEVLNLLLLPVVTGVETTGGETTGGVPVVVLSESLPPSAGVAEPGPSTLE